MSILRDGSDGSDGSDPHPQAFPVFTHHFVWRTFYSPTDCSLCRKFIWGIYKQGLQCKECLFICHGKCLAYSTQIPCISPQDHPEQHQQQYALLSKLPEDNVAGQMTEDIRSTVQWVEHYLGKSWVHLAYLYIYVCVTWIPYLPVHVSCMG